MPRLSHTLIIAASIALVGPVIAADDTKMAPDNKSMTKETGPGAGTPPGQPAGSETSDRSPDKSTTTPDSQTTTSGGETSDRTPEHHGEKK
jgi:hypothetical protein